jgi:hypothetical protein
MNNESENLWGPISLTEAINSPSSLLIQQAEVLKHLTGGTLLGVLNFSSGPVSIAQIARNFDIDTLNRMDRMAIDSHDGLPIFDHIDTKIGSCHLTIDFKIEVPDLGGYSFLVLKLLYSPEAGYPAFIISAAEVGNSFQGPYENEQQLKEAFKTIFRSPNIKKVIATLLTEVQASRKSAS